jgi:hypothetical protein
VARHAFLHSKLAQGLPVDDSDFQYVFRFDFVNCVAAMIEDGTPSTFP